MAPSRGLHRFLPTPNRPYICPLCAHRPPPPRNRAFTTTPPYPSGHNRWSKIKHDKARTDNTKTRLRSHYSGELATLSRLHGPDPSANPRLADTITKAKRDGFPKASIEAAIARGQGRGAKGEKLEGVTFEAVLRGNVGVIVECETESRLRTMASLKLAVKEAQGGVGPCGYLFRRRGRVVVAGREGSGVGVEEVLEVGIERGAVDVEPLQDTRDDSEGSESDNQVVIWTLPEETKAVGEAIAADLDLEVLRSEIVWSPVEETRVDVANDEMAGELAAFVDDVQEKETSVQSVAMNVGRGGASEGAWRELVSRVGVR